MLFNTPEFAVFFLLAFVITYALNAVGVTKIRNTVLLLASYGFYANLNICYPILLVWVTLVNFIGGRLLCRTCDSDKTRKVLISLVIILSLLPLIVLKYAPFYTQCLWLPIGLSFFTFQALTYSLDIYRRKITEAFSLLDVALFTAFFPTLLSGPIERARNLIPQLREKLNINWDNIVIGLQHFVWGLFKKIVVADRLAEWVDSVYSKGAEAPAGALALAAVLYSFQIYCDFSGYASMALGSGRMLGIRLTDNFNFPYFATSIKDFWRRWHISLTSWFTEYVYISLGGNRVSRTRWILNISAVFLLSGIWHGATWSFIIWGSIHGAMYLAEHFFGFRDKWGLYRIVVFVGITLAWIFFRIPEAADACRIIAKIFSASWLPLSSIISVSMTSLLMLLIFFLFIVTEWCLYTNKVPRHWLLQSIGFAFLLTVISLFAVSSEKFVYFQF